MSRKRLCFFRTPNIEYPYFVVRGEKGYAIPSTAANEEQRMAKHHPKLDVSDVIVYAISKSWRVVQAAATSTTP